jgi:hypothetical protein
MNDKIVNICHEHGIDVSGLDLSQDMSDLIYDIERMIINREVEVSDPRSVMAKLWKLEISRYTKALFSDPDVRGNLARIVSRKGYEIVGDFIECKKPISCSVIQTHDSMSMLNDKQQQKLKDMGYGIKSYKIRLGQTIREVYCYGKHPNLNDSNKQFCLDSEFLGLTLNESTIFLLEELLSHFNLGDCFLPLSELRLIKEACDI